MTLEQARKKARRFHSDTGLPVTIFRDKRENEINAKYGPYGCITQEVFDTWQSRNHEQVEVAR